MNKILVTGIGLLIVVMFSRPLAYMLVTGLKSYDQMNDLQVPAVWPFSRTTFNYEGKDLEIYMVPTDQGDPRSWRSTRRAARRACSSTRRTRMRGRSRGRATGACLSRSTIRIRSGGTSPKPGRN